MVFDNIPDYSNEIWEGILQSRLSPVLRTTILEEIGNEINRSRRRSYRNVSAAFEEADREERQKEFEYVAHTFESLARSYGDDGQGFRKAKLQALLNSGLAYESAASPANAQLLGNLASNYFNEFPFQDQSTEGPLEALEDITFRCCLQVLSKDLFAARATVESAVNNLAEMEQSAVNNYDRGDYQIGDLEHFTGLSLVMNGVRELLRSMMTPDGTDPDMGFISDAVELYRQIGDSNYWFFASLLRSTFAEMLRSSTSATLSRHFSSQNSRKYLVSLLSSQRNIFQLWPSQLSAVNDGIFDARTERLALSLPTSSGKTLIAESSIAKTLLEDPSARCIYLAPTRALVTEVEYNLKRSLTPLGIKVEQISPASELSDIEGEIAIENRVICMTPEKLDVILRSGHELLNSIRLIVVDEGHLLEDLERGELLEFAIIKLQIRFPSTKILFLSAVIPNIDEIAAWLGAQEHSFRHIRSDWRPTRIRIGEANLVGTTQDELMSNPVLRAANEQEAKRIIKRCRVDYTDGEQVDAYYVRYGEASHYTTNRQNVTALARSFSKLGSVLVLSTSKPRTEDIARDLASEEDVVSDDVLGGLAQKIRREIDPAFELADQIGRGVTYHHADLPPRIRFQIERAARLNKFKYIASTTTLAEGVNLPVSSLIVDDLNFRYPVDGGWRTHRMPARKFWNLAGRAGRALKDTEGHVIIFDPDRFFANEQEKDAFFNPDVAALEPVESVLLKMIKILEGNYRHLLTFDYENDPFENVVAIQSFLLALLDLEDILGDRYASELAIEEIVQHSLINYQKDASVSQKAHFRNFVRWGLSIIQSYSQLPIEQKRLIVRLGLSIKSANQLLANIQEFSSEELRSLVRVRNGEGLDNELITSLYEIAFDIPEIIPEHYSEILHPGVSFDWIVGTSVGDIARRYFTTYNRMLQSASNYLYGIQALNGAWGINSVVSVIRYFLDQRGVISEDEFQNREISLLPAYSAYGVGNLAAVVFCSRGIERLDAKILGDWFYESTGRLPENIVSTEESINWIRAIPVESIRSRILTERDSFDDEIIETIRGLGA